MWSDFKLWNRKCFERKRFKAHVHYADDTEIKYYKVDDIGKMDDGIQC